MLQERTGQHDPVAGRALADRLGGLPLALEQAGACAQSTETPLADYLTLLDTHGAALLAHAADDEARSVATTGQSSFRQLGDRALVAVELLTIAAFLAPTTSHATNGQHCGEAAA
jgi:hypothetical protein